MVSQLDKEVRDVLLALVLTGVGLGYSVSGLPANIVVGCVIWGAAWLFITHLFWIARWSDSCPMDVKIVLWAAATFMLVLAMWNPIHSQYLKEHAQSTPPKAPELPQSAQSPSEPVHRKSMVLHATKVDVISAEENKPLQFLVSTKNSGEADIDAASSSIAMYVSPWVLADIGEQHLFQLFASGATPKIVNPGFTIYPGQELGFKTPQLSPLTTDDMQKLRDGNKEFIYIIILLQYGKRQQQAYDDGLLRPHSVFCGFFDKLPNAEIRLCRGFNYHRPKE